MKAILDRLGRAVPGFNLFRALVVREFIDHRAGFITTPMVIGGLVILLTAGLLLVSNYSMIHFAVEGKSFKDILTTMSPDQWQAGFAGLEPGMAEVITASTVLSVVSPLFVAAPIVVFFALLGALHDDRKDRSYLFWKSMPVSDTQEVLVKFLAIVFIAPLVFIAFAALVQIAVMVLASVAALIHGWPVIGFIWSNTPISVLWLSIAIRLFVIALWLVPIAGWLLAVSAYAPKTPLLYAVVPPVAVVMTEGIFLGSHYVGGWISGRYQEPLRMFRQISENLAVSSDGINFSGQFLSVGDSVQVLGQSLASTDFWSGLAVGGLLIAVAVWLRRYQV